MGWFRHCISRRRRYNDISESIREHLDEKIVDLTDRGMTPEDAESTARREFGNLALIEERSREVWQWPRLRDFWTDVSFALRQFGNRPGFALVCVLTIALGVGANTAVFSVVDAVMLRPLPYRQPARLMEVEMMSSRHHYELGDVSYPDFFDWRTQNRSFTQLASYHDASFTLTGSARPARVSGEVVSWNLLPLLGIQPVLGRGFMPQDEKQGSRVVLISHALWVSHFSSSHSLLGQTIQLNGEPFCIIGVMPPSFRFPVSAPQISLWTAVAVDDNPGDPDPAIKNRGMRWLNVIGRLKPGVTPAQANQDLDAIVSRLINQFPRTNADNPSVKVESELTAVLGLTGILLKIVLCAVLLVLLVACGNIANLLLTRVCERDRELAMRAALGAGRARIVRQLLAESTLLGLVGGAAGCGLAFVAVPVLLRLIGDNVPRGADAGVNLPVLAFALTISLLSGFIFGVFPAWSASRHNPISTLKEGGHTQAAGHSWLRSIVIVAQIALGIVLTSGAGLLISSYEKMTHGAEGFNPDHLLTFSFDLPDARYKDNRQSFYQEYFDKLRALPGVASAAGSMFLPMTSNDMHGTFEDPEYPAPAGQRPTAQLNLISDRYFRTLQIPLLQGRDFAEADDPKAPPVMIVNRAFVEKYFAGNGVLGKKLRIDSLRQIVGVVGNTRQSAMQTQVQPMMYLPASQLPEWCCLASVVRTSADPLSLEPEVRHLLNSMDPELPLADVRTMRDLIGLQVGLPKLAAILLGTFAGLALILALVGLYGVMTYSITRRTKDIGVRLALGAQRTSVLALVLRDAGVLVACGVGLGLAITFAATSALKAILFNTGPRDPLVLAAVCAIMVLVGLLSAYLPAAKAAAIDPIVALRAE